MPRAKRAARAAGVTRLADITRLDRIGLPVWQAVRPGSLALSVHQGKGASHEDAQLGALLEAVESNAAERYEADGPVLAWSALPEHERADDLADFARSRTAATATLEVRWARAERPDGYTLWVPEDIVSLDFTRAKASSFERSSAGLATGSTLEEAQRSALLELIERDAVSRFEELDFIDRLDLEIDTDLIEMGSFEELLATIKAERLELRLFAPPSPTSMPVVIAGLRDPTKTSRPYVGTVGHAAHPDPNSALFQAVAEALQSRLTFIAGSRDDCWPWDYQRTSEGMIGSLAPPPVTGIDPLSFDTMEAGPSELDSIVSRVVRMGVDQLAFLKLADPEGFHVVRAFAPGLGSLAKAPRL